MKISRFTDAPRYAITTTAITAPLYRSQQWLVLSKTSRVLHLSCRIEGKIDRRNQMPDVTIVFWRDIPAQVIVGKGRRGAKRQLEERFEQAIDRAAMKVNAKDADAYLAEWRKAAPYPVDGDPDAVAEAEAVRLETEYDTARIKALIDNEGWA